MGGQLRLASHWDRVPFRLGPDLNVEEHSTDACLNRFSGAGRRASDRLLGIVSEEWHEIRPVEVMGRLKEERRTFRLN
jgi:hypothetical protein